MRRKIKQRREGKDIKRKEATSGNVYEHFLISPIVYIYMTFLLGKMKTFIVIEIRSQEAVWQSTDPEGTRSGTATRYKQGNVNRRYK